VNGSFESVYVVPRGALFPGGAPHGFVRDVDGFLGRIYREGRFAPRGPVEEDPSLKQVIPYALLVRGQSCFCFARSCNGGERRLQGLRSIGVGGHVNPVDAEDVVLRALRREVDEEVLVPAGWEARIVGLLNDDTTPVGSVHVGVVAVIETPPGVVRVREEDRMSGSFVDLPELLDLHRRERASFESWTALLLDRIDEVLAWDRPHDSSTPTRRPTRISTT